MTRLIRVGNCDDCPHVEITALSRGMRRLQCTRVLDNSWRESRATDCSVIPDWCPLPEEASDAE